MFEIDKTFNFEYGHRVWTQTLNTEFSLDNACKCRAIHGHSGKVKVGLISESLHNSMVTDFKHLNFFKKLVDDVFDHKLILDFNDPLLQNMFPEIFKNDEINSDVLNETKFYSTVNLDKFKNSPQCIQEKLDGLVLVNFTPTSENLSKFFLEIADEKLRNLNQSNFVRVKYVDFYETQKSHCRYINPVVVF